ncbi:MAG: GTP cyclohydrolase I FolE [Candidatus Heimdallarchaeaceae archaeon]
MKRVNDSREKLFVSFISSLLEWYGENPSREGLADTPRRVSRMYDELLAGYSQDPSLVFKTFKDNGYKDLVSVTNIDFYSLCEHHMIPFFGKIHIGYLPNGKILGLSKFVRLIDIFSKRLQTQENLTNQIADSLEKYLKPKGVIVTIEAEHLCMAMRGVKKKDCITKTTTIRGVLKRDSKMIDQFYREINRAKDY